MKICWDTLEKIRIGKKGNFIDITAKSGNVFFERDNCLGCGDHFLGKKDELYCERACSFTSELRNKKISKARKGKPLSNEHKKKIGLGVKGELCHLWKGGVATLVLYDYYAPRLEPYEECRRQEEDPNILEVKCSLCGTWYTPTVGEARGRIYGIEDNDGSRFYCSPRCKQECPIYGMSAKNLMRQDAVRAGRIPLKKLRNEVPGWIRKRVLELDDYTCQLCGCKNKKLHVHHEIPQKRNQMLAADIDNSLSMCIPCHWWVHMNIGGCKYNDLAKLETC